MFPDRNIHKFIWIFPLWKYDPIENILIDRIRYSSILDVPTFKGAGFDTGHYLVVAKFSQRLAVIEETTHRFYMERFNLKKLIEIEGKEQYCVDISNRLAALESLDTEVNINRAWETIRENIKIPAKESLGCYELKKHKTWFDEGCSELLDKRK
jgi:hypothetical protein